MFKFAGLLALAALASARRCSNITVPVSLSARNAVFDLDLPTSEIDVTNFFLKFSTQNQNYSDSLVEDYATVKGIYQLATTYCEPDSGPGDVLQVLTHGVGFDRSYWDLPHNNYNYSYVAQAVDEFGYSTLSWDRLGVGASSKGDPLSEIQIFLEIAAVQELTTKLREGKVWGVGSAYNKVVHVGHSFGSAITYALSRTCPELTDGIILTGFSQAGSFIGLFGLGGNFAPVKKIAALANNYPAGYLGAGDRAGVHINFFGPGDFDPEVLDLTYETGQPASPGELLTVGAGAGEPNSFSGPVLVITGERDIPFCGGDCMGTSAVKDSAPNAPNLLAVSNDYFKNASPFNATVVPGAGHGLNLGYSHTFTYNTMLEFFDTYV